MPNLDWNSIISRIKLNPFISVLDNIQSTIPNINPALNILRSAFNEPKQSQVFIYILFVIVKLVNQLLPNG